MRHDITIEITNVSKKFCKSLKHSMLYGLQDIGRNMLGRSSHSGSLRKDEFWAIHNVSFEVRRGETLGLIGPNGAGKTTLLKMLNGIFWPDNGKISIRGKVGALIQVGAGFHPLLTGRENIYINAAILGMAKEEVDRKFEDIVGFADIGDFLDTPVKFYSSGMFIRLGFAIAVHLEPDILLIDEVLSVGDASFRSKSMEKMWQLAHTGETTIVFVSHNIPAVEGFCDRIIMIDKGVPHFGSKDELIAQYYGDDVNLRLQQIHPELKETFAKRRNIAQGTSTEEIHINDIRITDKDGAVRTFFRPTDTLVLEISFNASRKIEKVISSISFNDSSGLILSVERSNYHGIDAFCVDGDGSLRIEISPLQLKTGKYLIGLAFQDPSLETRYCLRAEDYIKVIENMPNPGGKEGFFKPFLSWKIVK